LASARRACDGDDDDDLGEPFLRLWPLLPPCLLLMLFLVAGLAEVGVVCPPALPEPPTPGEGGLGGAGAAFPFLDRDVVMTGDAMTVCWSGKQKEGKDQWLIAMWSQSIIEKRMSNSH